MPDEKLREQIELVLHDFAQGALSIPEAALAIFAAIEASGTDVLAPVEPTEAQLVAARDWSLKKYGRGVGNDDATGCYHAMLAARPRYAG